MELLRDGRSATRRGKKQHLLTPTTFTLIHCTDFADRYERNILPMLKAGFIVLADRYKFTAFARDTVRGCPQEWVDQLYSFAFQPDITFYFPSRCETALNRILVGRPALKYHEAGMDLGLSPDPVESFKIFQGRILKEYETLARRYRFTRIDSARSVRRSQEEVRAILRTGSTSRNTRWRSREGGEYEPGQDVLGKGIPGVCTGDLKGKLIVLEGPDGSGPEHPDRLSHRVAGAPRARGRARRAEALHPGRE